MSAGPAPASTVGSAHAPPAADVPREVCPLCGGPLRRDQDWCLRCGAAARTRLAAPAKWKALVVVVLLVALVALGVLTAALLKLAG